jgi:hypothetical protein
MSVRLTDLFLAFLEEIEKEQDLTMDQRNFVVEEDGTQKLTIISAYELITIELLVIYLYRASH